MTQRMIVIPGSPELAADIAGAGPTVVFVHGIGGNRLNWAGQMETFSGRYQTIAVDLRGYGDSADPDDGFAFFDFVDDILRTLDFVGVETADLVGLSMGGLVVQAVAARAPERVRSLTLAGCRAGDSPVFDDPASFAAERIGSLSADAPATIAVDAMLPRLLGPAVSPEAARAIRGSLELLRPANYRRTMMARLAIPPFLDLSTIAVPTLVIGASHDKVAPLAQMQGIAARIPGARFATIADAGHLMNIEQPDAFDTVLASFLESVPRFVCPS
ncbi:alpha/beta fold hydrolase [Acuticoccus kandeliae]|uniref:alpha/beta fold hydrolase n=1 Tax=Acuticoccus kandeliae TaxID=2073160 RepID=UPI000D3E0E7F|nr:alpha/beta fold hydrolase [Acuticoccus kandeliae]